MKLRLNGYVASFAATQNILVPDVKDRMLRDLMREIERLETVPGMALRKEGAQRFYKSLSELIASI